MGASATKAAWDSAHQLKKERKVVSKLLAWGKSESNQCGVPINGTLIRPKKVRNLPSMPIAGIFAGHRHSAAILEDGSVYTWGRNTNGELGVGRRSDSESVPQLIQQLDQSTKFSHAAIGDTHMLLVDQEGGMWASGSNDWGQLGLGSPLQALSSEFDKPRISKRPTGHSEPSSMPVVVMRDHMNSRLQSMGLQSVATGDAVAGHLLRPPPTLDKESAVNIANTNITVDAALVSANNRCAAAAGLSSVSDLLIWNDIVPNQSHFPVRIGRDVSPPFDTFSDGPRVVTFAEIEFNKTLAALGLTAGVRSPQQFVDLLSAMPRMGATGPGGASMAAQRDSDWPPLHGAGKVLGYQQHQGGQAAESALPWHAQGLHELAVVKAAAAGPCSVALTAAGEVWMFGYGQEQQFANGNAVQTEGWPVDGRPARLIAEQGGAVDVVAGAAFCAALTRSGAVVLWGRGAPQGMLCSGGTTRFVKALPKMTRVAAGRAHLLMSDGASVWQLRIRHDADTPAAVLSTLKRVRFEGDFGGVDQLEAGGDASAVVCPDGKLWMWGQVTDTTMRGELPAAQTAHGQAALPCIGSPRKQPTLITDMDPVTRIALGTNHVLAVTTSV